MQRTALTTLCILAMSLCACAHAPVVKRDGVIYSGRLERADAERALYQNLILDLASAWVNCDPAVMRSALAPDVDFSYPSRRLQGVEAALDDLDEFCAKAENRSIYFPVDAFYIDPVNKRVAAELQFRATLDGQRQVVNDVWIATVKGGRIAVIKEYLDGRVKGLQAQGILSKEETAPFLTPWPPFAQQTEK